MHQLFIYKLYQAFLNQCFCLEATVLVLIVENEDMLMLIVINLVSSAWFKPILDEICLVDNPLGLSLLKTDK